MRLTRLMVALAWMSVVSALGMALLPAPASILGILLVGAVGLAGLRARGSSVAPAGVLAATLFVCVRLALAGSRPDHGAALHDPGLWASTLLAAGWVLGTAPMAAWATAGPAQPAAASLPESPPAQPAQPPPLLVGTRSAGLRQVEAEIARAAEEVRDLSLALLGVDGAGDGDDARVMQRLDEAVFANLTPSDGVSEFGPTERLVVLPGVSARALLAGAPQLCMAAAEQAGRPVRAALATFPADGSTPRYLLDRLELGLAACRAERTTVASGRPSKASRMARALQY